MTVDVAAHEGGRYRGGDARQCKANPAAISPTASRDAATPERRAAAARQSSQIRTGCPGSAAGQDGTLASETAPASATTTGCHRRSSTCRTPCSVGDGEARQPRRSPAGPPPGERPRPAGSCRGNRGRRPPGRPGPNRKSSPAAWPCSPGPARSQSGSSARSPPPAPRRLTETRSARPAGCAARAIATRRSRSPCCENHRSSQHRANQHRFAPEAVGQGAPDRRKHRLRERCCPGQHPRPERHQ